MADQLPFWSDDCDMDLPKVIPDWLEILGDVAEVQLFTHAHTTFGRINCPAAWDMGPCHAAFFGFESPCLPDGYHAVDPAVACTFAEVIRDEWYHGADMRIEGRTTIRRAPQRAFDALMEHRRGYRVLDDARLATAEQMVRKWIRLCAEELRREVHLRKQAISALSEIPG